MVNYRVALTCPDKKKRSHIVYLYILISLNAIKLSLYGDVVA